MEYDLAQFINSDLIRFMRVAEAGGFSKASERSGVQQAALSKAVAHIEHGLGEKLFVRRRSGVELTIAGQRLLRRLSQWQSDLKEDLKKTTAEASEPQGLFRIGANQTVARNVLTEVWPEIWKKYPRMQLDLFLGRSIEITRKVINRDLDFGFVVNPVRMPDLTIIPIRSEDCYVYSYRDEKELISAPLLYNPMMVKIERFLNRFKNHLLVPISDYELLAAIAETSESLAVLPESVGQRFARLKSRGKPLMKVQISLIYRRDNIQNSGAEQLIRMFKNV